jgi:uncharacterized protein (TIGR02722 family)
MKQRGSFCLIGLITLIFLGTASCSSNPTVSRVEADTQIDLSGYWNDGDVRIVCESLINDCINSPRVAQAITAKKDGLPVVLIGSFKNDSSEHIDTSIIAKTMEVAIFNSGLLDFVAGGNTREELRAEREDQNNFNASEETAALLGSETGADFLLTGSVKTIIDQAGNQTVRTYYVSAEMSNISTNTRMWMGQNSEIKKVITRSRVKL